MQLQAGDTAVPAIRDVDAGAELGEQMAVHDDAFCAAREQGWRRGKKNGLRERDQQMRVQSRSSDDSTSSHAVCVGASAAGDGTNITAHAGGWL